MLAVLLLQRGKISFNYTSTCSASFSFYRKSHTHKMSSPADSDGSQSLIRYGMLFAIVLCLLDFFLYLVMRIFGLCWPVLNHGANSKETRRQPHTCYFGFYRSPWLLQDGDFLCCRAWPRCDNEGNGLHQRICWPFVGTTACRRPSEESDTQVLSNHGHLREG